MTERSISLFSEAFAAHTDFQFLAPSTARLVRYLSPRSHSISTFSQIPPSRVETLPRRSARAALPCKMKFVRSTIPWISSVYIALFILVCWYPHCPSPSHRLSSSLATLVVCNVCFLLRNIATLHLLGQRVPSLYHVSSPFSSGISFFLHRSPLPAPLSDFKSRLFLIDDR